MDANEIFDYAISFNGLYTTGQELSRAIGAEIEGYRGATIGGGDPPTDNVVQVVVSFDRRVPLDELRRIVEREKIDATELRPLF